MRMIFVSLPVRNPGASGAFFAELSAKFNLEFPGDRAACLVADDNSFVVLLPEERFRDFINGEISDTPRTAEVLTHLSAGRVSRTTRVRRLPIPEPESRGRGRGMKAPSGRRSSRAGHSTAATVAEVVAHKQRSTGQLIRRCASWCHIAAIANCGSTSPFAGRN